MPHIFISYRRSDSSAYAGRIFDRLKDRFDDQNVFRDLDTIPPGAEFAKIIAERISKCDVLIVIIGKNWLSAKNDEGRLRLNDPADFVRVEIASALKLGKLVIPCLVEGVAIPKQKLLPRDIAPLAGRNAIEISETRFDYDVERLIKAIAPNIPEPSPHSPSSVDSAGNTGGFGIVRIGLATLLVTIMLLTFADLKLGWQFDSAEISLLTLLVLGVCTALSKLIARINHHAKKS